MRSFLGSGLLAGAAFVLAVAGCSAILGIDNQYVEVTAEGAVPEEAGGKSGGEGDASASAGGFNGGGGSGGLGGGEAGPGSAGIGSSNGGASAPDVMAPPACRTGLYEGTFDGVHRPSATVVGAPVPATGTLTFRLEPRDGVSLQITMGSLSGELVTTAAPFGASLTGAVDCTSERLAGDIVAGTLTVPPFSVGFVGTFSGTYRAVSDTYGGAWSEHETATTTATGDGTWTASWVAP